MIDTSATAQLMTEMAIDLRRELREERVAQLKREITKLKRAAK